MIPSFTQYLKEDKNTVYFTFGRMNPPTIGHGKLLDKLASVSGASPYKVFLSQTSDSKKNPLSYKDKVKHVRKMFPKHARSVMSNNKVINALDAAVQLYKQGYSNIVMVVGQDRIREFDVLLNKYNGKDARHGFYNFNSIKVVSAGNRDPDAEGVEGMSASKQRSNAAENDYTAFSQGVPRSMSDRDTRQLFNDVRRGMGLKEQQTFRNHVDLPPVSETRELYVSGDLYAVGDTVVISKTSDVAIIEHLGSNYVIVESNGRRMRKWLTDVEPLDEALTTPYKFKMHKGTIGDYTAIAKLADGGELFIEFLKDSPTTGSWEIIFSRFNQDDDDFSDTPGRGGGGDPFKVLSTVVAATKKWISNLKQPPSKIYFTGSKESTIRSGSRDALYSRFARIMAKELGMKVSKKSDATGFEWTLTTEAKQPEWGTPESTAKAKKMTPGQGKSEPEKDHRKGRNGFKTFTSEQTMDMARDRIARDKQREREQDKREKEQMKKKHDRILDRARRSRMLRKNAGISNT